MRFVISNKIKEDSAYSSNVETIIVLSLVVTFIMTLLALPNLLLNRSSLMAYDKLEYYTDELGLISEPEKLEDMKVFHEKTGVKPYIYFVDDIMNEDSPDNSTVATWTNENAGEASLLIISLFMVTGFFIKIRKQKAQKTRKAIEEQKEYERAINIINTPMEKLIQEQNVNKTTLISIGKDDHYIKSLFEKYKQPKENLWLK